MGGLCELLRIPAKTYSPNSQKQDITEVIGIARQVMCEIRITP
jgi:hypothetical protein